MICSDYHIHSRFSEDCGTPLHSIVETAIQKGLERICITDHDDYGFEADEIGALKNPEEYVAAIQRLREEYEDRIEILLGVEMGMQPIQDVEAHFSKLTEEYPFDFVINSMHIVDGRDPYFGELFDEMSDEDAYRFTFQHMQECIRKIPDFDVLGHIDYIVRYGTQKAEHYSCLRLSEELDALLQTVIDMGKGIEINTSGLRYLGFCHPHMDILQRYRELGGEIITFGSDAHRPEDIAYGFHLAEELLRSIGYKYYTCFRKREAFFMKI